MSGDVRVRAGRAADGEALRTIEREAGVRFREIGMPEIADDEPASVEELAGYAAAGRSWVAVDGSDRPVGYVIVDLVDGCGHVEQVSVRPDQQGRGVGRALLARVEEWATGESATALTLTTFRDVPWNRPLYEHLGFRVLEEREIGAGLRAVIDHEAELGLDPTTRVAMRRPIGPAVDT